MLNLSHTAKLHMDGIAVAHALREWVHFVGVDFVVGRVALDIFFYIGVDMIWFFEPLVLRFRIRVELFEFELLFEPLVCLLFFFRCRRCGFQVVDEVAWCLELFLDVGDVGVDGERLAWALWLWGLVEVVEVFVEVVQEVDVGPFVVGVIDGETGGNVGGELGKFAVLGIAVVVRVEENAGGVVVGTADTVARGTAGVVGVLLHVEVLDQLRGVVARLEDGSFGFPTGFLVEHFVDDIGVNVGGVAVGIHGIFLGFRGVRGANLRVLEVQNLLGSVAVGIPQVLVGVANVLVPRVMVLGGRDGHVEGGHI